MIVTDTFNLFWQFKHDCANKSYNPELMSALFTCVMDPKQDGNLKRIHQVMRKYYDHDLSEDEWVALAQDAAALVTEMPDAESVISVIVDILDKKARAGK